MTDKMKDFIKTLEKARNGEDEGLNTLKTIGLKLDTVVSRRYGSVYITYTQVLKLGTLMLDKINTTNLYCSNDNKLFYVQKIKFNGTKETSVLNEPFEVCIAHNLDRVNIGNFKEFEALVEKSIDVFVVTKYGIFDIYNTIKTNISLETAIENSFKKEDIVVYPSNKSVLARDLNKEMAKMTKKEGTLNLGNKSKVFLGYAPCGNTIFDPNIKYLTSAYINGKYFCEFKCNYFNEAKIVVRSVFSKEVVFDSIISIFGLKTKISSELLAKKNEWTIIDDIVQNTNIPKFNSGLLHKLPFYTVKRGISDIKHKYYSDLVCSINEKKMKDIINEMFINYRLTFKERTGNQFAFGKLIFLNSEFMDKSNDNYDVSLYRQYIISCNNKIYKVNEILVENKQRNNVFLTSLLEIGAQVKLIKDNVSLPVLYFIPCDIMLGTEVDCMIENSISDKLALDKRVQKFICDKMIEEFGNIYASEIILKQSYNGSFVSKMTKALDEMQKVDISSELEEDIIQFMQEII